MRPWRSNEERLVDEALERQQMAGTDVQASYDPSKLFPPRFGYGDKAQRTPDIRDCFSMGHYEPDRRYDFSGTASGLSGAGDVSVNANPLG